MIKSEDKTCKYCPRPEDKVKDKGEKKAIRALPDYLYRRLCLTDHTSCEHEVLFLKGVTAEKRN